MLPFIPFSFLLSLACIWGGIHIRNFVHAILPVRYQIYWFVTAYMGMYLLSPYINKMVWSLTKQEYQRLLILLMGMFSLYSFLRQDADPFSIQGGYTIWWLLVLYHVGGYIRLYGIQLSQRKALFIYISMCVLTFLCKKPLFYIFKTLGLPTGGMIGFYGYNSPTIVIASVALFIFFLRIRISYEKGRRWIYFFSSSSFGVYLIHENPFIRHELWGHWIHTKSMFSSSWFIVHFIVTIIGIYVICVLIDKIRERALKFIVSRYGKL
ncbi:acyltransferase family protein [uncultured Veillonella sp.]|uniref:acyltransferase family protein n=1 Tax=uncultured Veillonella sp. TaxID=159268 RepID=UPI00338DEAF3